MEIYRLHHPYEQQEIYAGPIVLALGFFDGVHLGHQAVIKKAREVADKKGIKLALMTFNRHPGVVFEKYDTLDLCYLTTLEEKEKRMQEEKVDILYEVDFTSAFASLSPEGFTDHYIVALHAEAVVAGFDYTYGKKEVATMERLPYYAKDRFEVHTVSPSLYHGVKVSSTNIKREVRRGNIEEANQMLGYDYQTPGFVIHGEARGRELGYPTANIQIEKRVCLPKKGIYAVRMTVNGTIHNGMASIGYNVTFGDRREISIEVNLFDFHEEIYGEDVVVHWVAYLRDEIKFDSIEGLINQLREDEFLSRKLLQNPK